MNSPLHPVPEPAPARETHLRETPRVVAAGASDIGRSRSTNEDAFLVARFHRGLVLEATNLPEIALHPPTVEATLLIVADGMGGEGSGDVASRLGIQGVVAALQQRLPPTVAVVGHNQPRDPQASFDGVRRVLDSALQSGNAEIVNAAQDPENSPRMGSTLTLAYVVYPNLYVAHVGDSRCYLLREGQLFQLTRDHTLAEQYTQSGREAPDEYADILLNALGAGLETPTAELCKIALAPDDLVLLCSDGLTKHVSSEELAPMLAKPGSPAEQCGQLISLTNERGGSDNVTVVVARLQ